MLAEGKQKPIYSIAEASNFDNIRIAISHVIFEAQIKKLIKETEELVAKPDANTNLVSILSLHDAALKVNELISLKRDHPEIPRLIDLINKSLEMYKEPTIIWLGRNIMVALLKINDIRDHLYEKLFDLVDRLSFNELVTISESYLASLNVIFIERISNTKFGTPDDLRLNLLTAKLRTAFDNEKRENKENSLKQVFFYNKDPERRKAIIIGINEYESSEIPSLDGSKNDAKEIHDKLIQYDNFEISDDQYLIGSEATRRKILKAVYEVFHKDNKYDLVTFYFSGHGVMDETTNEAYLAPYDMDPEAFFVSGISMKELKKAIYNTKNIANTIIILDCSYAGIMTSDTK